MDDDINFDTLIVGQISVREKWTKERSELESKALLGTATKEDKVALGIAKAKIKEAEDAIAELNKTRNQIKSAEETEAISTSLAEEQAIIDKLIKENSIGFLPEENKYIYCMGMERKNTSIVNPIFKMVDATRFCRTLSKMANLNGTPIQKYSDEMYHKELKNYFQRIGKDYFGTTASFIEEKWSSDKVYNKMQVIRKFWVQPNYQEATGYAQDFDLLMHCVGGGKKENIDHLEQWIAYKWMFPERLANTPNVDIGGYPGGNGKGRYFELCKTVFTNPCIVVAAKKELMESFNGTWEMATLLYYDEPAEKELPANKLKQATGGEESRSEKKGIDATIIDRNFNILFVSNNMEGVVQLAGTGSSGEDRRYSVIITDIVMVDEVMKRYNLGEEDAKVYVNAINNLIKNRVEVAKWLAHIIVKHNIKNMEILRPLHGIDYRARFEDQKSDLSKAFDTLMPIYQKTTCITTKLLHELCIAITGFEKLSDKKTTKEFKQYLAKNKVEFTYDKYRVKHMFGGSECFETNTYAFINTGSTRLFDHTLIAGSSPTKTTIYTKDNISLGKDEPQESNVVPLKPKAKTAADLIALLHKKDE